MGVAVFFVLLLSSSFFLRHLRFYDRLNGRIELDNYVNSLFLYLVVVSSASLLISLRCSFIVRLLAVGHAKSCSLSLCIEAIRVCYCRWVFAVPEFRVLLFFQRILRIRQITHIAHEKCKTLSSGTKERKVRSRFGLTENRVLSERII